MTPVKTSILLGIIVCIALIAGTRNVGVTWDEPIYLHSANQMLAFFKDMNASRFTDQEIQKYFDASQWKDVHPTFAKALGAFTLALTGKFQDDLYAYRFGNILLASIVAALIYFFLSRHFQSWRTGLLTALVCIAMPRVAGQFQIGDTDTTLYLVSFPAAIAGYLSATNGSWRWGMVCGILCGICVTTRYTGLVVPLGIFLWTFLYHRDQNGVYNLFTIPFLSPLIFVLLNPQLWKDPIFRSFVYFARSSGRHITEPHVGFMFQFFNHTPWYYAPILILTTIPLLSLLIIAIGIVQCSLKERDHLAGLFAMLAALPVLIVTMPGNVAYDGVRLFLVTFLYLGLFSAWAFAHYEDWIKRNIVFVPLVIALLAPPVLAYPFELEYYGPQIGGTRGAANIGLEITYWWDAANQAFYKQANDVLPQGGSVAMLPADQPFLDYYQQKKYLHVDVVPPGKSDFVILLCRPSCDNERLKQYVGQFYKDLDLQLSYPNKELPFVMVLRNR